MQLFQLYVYYFLNYNCEFILVYILIFKFLNCYILSITID